MWDRTFSGLEAWVVRVGSEVRISTILSVGKSTEEVRKHVERFNTFSSGSTRAMRESWKASWDLPVELRIAVEV